jgi:hypothetical protein
MKKPDSLYYGADFLAEEVFLLLVCNLTPCIMLYYLLTSRTDLTI